MGSDAADALARLERIAHLSDAADHWRAVGFERALCARDESDFERAGRAFRIAALLAWQPYRRRPVPTWGSVAPMMMDMAILGFDMSDAFHDVCMLRSRRGEICCLPTGHEGPHRPRIGDSTWTDEIHTPCAVCETGWAWQGHSMCNDCEEMCWGDFVVGDVAMVTSAVDDTADPRLIGERVRVVGMDGWMLTVRRIVGNRETGEVWHQELTKQGG